jgi:hypothetical protein
VERIKTKIFFMDASLDMSFISVRSRNQRGRAARESRQKCNVPYVRWGTLN